MPLLIGRRLVLAGAGLATWAVPSRAAVPIEVLSADVRPLSIAEGPRRGLVLDIVDEALQSLGYAPRFTFLPFADALARTRSEPGLLMTPLARSPQREALFAWVAEIVDVPQAMGTLVGRPVIDLEGARSLQRIGVVSGGVQEGFLRDRGFTNLVALGGARELARALAEGRINAWYSTATEITLQFEAIGQAGLVRVGPTIQSAPVWLGGNLDTAGIPVRQLASAVAALKQSGTIDRIYRSYVPS